MTLPKLQIDSNEYALPFVVEDSDFDPFWSALQLSFKQQGIENDLFDGPLYHVNKITSAEIVAQSGLSYRQFMGMRGLVKQGVIDPAHENMPRVLGVLVVLVTQEEKILLFPRSGGEWGDCYELPGYSWTPRFHDVEQVVRHVIHSDCVALESKIQIDKAKLLGSIELPQYLEHDVLIQIPIHCTADEIRFVSSEVVAVDLEEIITTDFVAHPPTREAISHLISLNQSGGHDK